MTYKGLLPLAFAQVTLAASLFVRRDEPRVPIVTLDDGTFEGTFEGSVSAFRGIPYAQPPVGDLRFRLPVPNDPYNGTHNATAYGAACIQQASKVSDPANLNPIAVGVLQEILSAFSAPGLVDDEDCLTINVVAPANTTQESKLPVIYWIYGGGFQTGATSNYNGSTIVERSLQLNEPVIFVSVNYRLSALGFAGSAEVREAGVGNIGLQDQRQGLRWVQQYISAFGGDPSKVTIWGESAGSISVAMQMVANNGDREGLFRGAFMQSGGPVSEGTGQVEQGQSYFDKFAWDAGCGDSLGSTAVFDCLRNASVTDIRSAIQSSQNLFDYSSASLAWQPRADGIFLTDNAQRLVRNHNIADVPYIIGDDDDEGTVFSLVNTNITTEAELRQYLQEFYFPSASTGALIDNILSAYPEDPALGSPFDTGTNNSITPEYKRLSAITGDFIFHAPRRLLLSEHSGNANAFSYLYKRGKEIIPTLGAFHGSDINAAFGPGELQDGLINFATNLDPNGETLIDWPVYTNDAPALFTMLDGNVSQEITEDMFRAEGIQAILKASLAEQ